ncbi:MAG: SpoIID/LytB domain-containing protein [bacterium]|nr:SpoIID/LytB domain-containing protein [bacterium]
MNIRVAVLRRQSEIVIRCASGSFTLEKSNGTETIHTDEERRFSLSSPLRECWLTRTKLSQLPLQGAEPIGVHADTALGEVTSHKWLVLLEADKPTTPDALFTQAVAIAHSAAPNGELLYPDERRDLSASLLIGWSPVADSLKLIPDSPQSTLSIQNVQIGIGFHWDHVNTMLYSGTIRIYALKNGLAAVVETPLEEYLATVNSSEMPAEMPLEFLKAQTVAARSWLRANLGSHYPGAPFDVCSDDHCQCYQGSVKIKENSLRASQETAGQILICKDSSEKYVITDARYAKTCGGRFEPGARVWGGETPGLLYAHDHVTEQLVPPIDTEVDAYNVIENTETNDYCNPKLYPYPPSLTYCEPYYRWQQELTCAELGQRITRATGIEIGAIQSLESLERGPSGRIHRLQVVGEKNTIEISGELAIRRALSDSHLPSSAIVWKFNNPSIVLLGAGWGHGAGLCQTGAAIRATHGASYQEILSAYYPDSILETMSACRR